MAKLSISNPTIPLGSTILVTASNGLIASHVVDQLLAAGYRVRGTVRDLQKCAWMESLYTKRHGSGHFEMVQISDFFAPGAWDTIIKGVAGVVSAAGGVELQMQDGDLERALEEDLDMATKLMSAAKNEPSVKAFVLTSSAWATYTPDANRKQILTEWTWNYEAIKLVADSDVPSEQKGITPFMALKTRLEQECWEWVKREKPAFTFNTILLDTVLGECLDPKHQGIPSTAGMVKRVWDGTHRGFLNAMQPQWHIDTVDAGLLYVAALTTPGCDGERIFGFGNRYSFHRVAGIMKDLYPNKEIVPVEYLGVDQTEVPNDRGAELLRLLGRKGWTSLEESVKANVESILELETSDA